jgi:hypothetical protein
MSDSREISFTQWGVAWIGPAIALALHVADEALNDSLPLYDRTVQNIRA